MRRKHPGKPALYDDIDADWFIMWLISIPMLIGKIEPIRVRARKTKYGWRGWHVGGDATKPPTHWYGHLWKPATVEESAKLDAEYGTETPVVSNDVPNPVCDVTRDKSA